MEYVASYTGGIDQDTAISKRDPSTYYTAKNIRVILAEGLDSGWVSNIKGTKDLNITDWFDEALRYKGFHTVSLSIIGSGEIRDSLVLFTVDSIGDSYIFTITIDNDDIQTCTLIYSDFNTSDSSKLNLAVSYPIRGFEANYVSSEIQNIYWTDFRDDGVVFNPLRYMNIAQSDLLTGTTGLPASTFDILPNCTLEVPIVTDISVGGNLLSGLVQYTYQLYNLHGSETLFSPLSNLIHLTDASETLTDTINYKGAEVETNTGKLVNLYITPDTRFSNIKVYAVHYEDYNQLPSVRLIQDSPTSNTIYIKDSGESLDTLTIEEFVSLRENFTAKDIKSKDNILFAANIKTKTFDFDYDARAYRFKKNLTFTNLSDIAVKKVNGVFVTLTGATVREDFDCINTDNTNKLQNLTTDCLYQWNSTKLGGSGTNVSYEFSSDTLRGDEDIFSNIKTIKVGDSGDYKNYANPNKASFRHHQSDEIYRYALIGYNDKFEPSFPKWIGDIRIPNSEVYNLPVTLSTIYFYPIKIKFTVTNLPPEVKYYQIVRVKREEEDRTVVASGIVTKTMEYESTTPNQYRSLLIPNCGPVGITYTYPDNILAFISPEINFNKNLSWKDGDYISSYYKFNAKAENIVTVPSNKISYYKYYGTEALTTPFYKDIELSITTSPAYTTTATEYPPVDLNADYKFLNWVETNATGADNYGPGGTKVIMKLDSDISHTSNYELYIVNYKRVRENQYGGNGYIARTKNTYIPASTLYPATTTQAVSYGDTFISMFEHLYSIWKEDLATTGNAYFCCLYFPVETTINQSLRLGTTINNDQEDTGVFAIQEEASKQLSTSYTQTQDLYRYNSVYSRESDVITFTAKPINYREQSEYDCDTKYSNTKVTGEYVDSWTKFLLNNRNTVESKYGPINKLEFFRNQLVFIQDKAVGVWGVNAKELITTAQPGALSVGTGGILDRFDYIDTNSGTRHQFSVANTTDFIYYFDYHNKSFVQFAGQGDNLISKLKGVNATFKNKYYHPTHDDNIICVYDRINEDITWTVLSGTGEDEYTTITYNQLLQKFTTFLDMYPTNYFKLGNYIFAYDGELWLMNKGDYGKLLGSHVETEVGILAAPNQGRTCGFNSIKYANEVFDGTVNLVDVTLSKIYANTNYQDSTILNLGLYPDEAVRRNRIWRTYIPRDINDDIMSDGMIKLYLNFLNKNNYKFRLGECIINFNPTIE